jgi:hypothetical protein
MTRAKFKFIFAILAALLIAANIPGVSLAQSSQSGQVPSGQSYVAGQQGQVNPNQPPGPPAAVNPNPTGQTGRQTPEPKGGVATVISVDQPDNCLRIRSGPGSAYDVIGCVGMGQQLNITGVWASNDWAQVTDNGWVYGPQIQTDLRPPAAAYSQAGSYATVEDAYPLDYDAYPDYYLPDYGYETYWYGGVPLFLYNVNVWRKFHPWWFHRHGVNHQRVWNQNRAFRQSVRTGTSRNLATNQPNVTRFNSNRFRTGTPNTIRSGRTVSPNTTFRSFSGPNTTFRSFSSPSTTTRSFSRPNTTFRSFSSPSTTARSFSRPNTTFRSFTSPSTGRSFGTRSFSANTRSFSSGRVGGFSSSARIGGGGGGARMGGGGGRR